MITSDVVAEVWNVLLFSVRLFKQMATVLAGSAGFVLTENRQTVQPGTAKVMDRVVDRTRWPTSRRGQSLIILSGDSIILFGNPLFGGPVDCVVDGSRDADYRLIH